MSQNYGDQKFTDKVRTGLAFTMLSLLSLWPLSPVLAQAINSEQPQTYIGKFWRVYSPRLGGHFVLYDKGWAPGVYMNTTCAEDRCLWMLSPSSSGGYFYVLNVGSGNALCVKDGATDNRISNRNVDWHETHRPGDALKHATWCEWKLDPVGSDQYRIKNLNSGKCITVRDCKYAYLSHWQCVENACNQFVIAVDKMKKVDVPALAEASAEPPDVFRLNSYDDLRKLPEQGKPIVVGETLLPYVAVADKGRTPGWQIQNSPYYVLSRTQAYRVEQSDDVGEGISEKLTITVTEGASTASSQMVENTMGWRVTGKASFQMGGFSMGLEAEVSKQLKLTKSTSTTEYKEKKMQREFETPTSRIVYAIWTLVNQYELRRSDGSVVARWDVYTDRHIVDSYPRAGLQGSFD